jgi:hypothetical protein
MTKPALRLGFATGLACKLPVDSCVAYVMFSYCSRLTGSELACMVGLLYLHVQHSYDSHHDAYGGCVCPAEYLMDKTLPHLYTYRILDPLDPLQTRYSRANVSIMQRCILGLYSKSTRRGGKCARMCCVKTIALF